MLMVRSCAPLALFPISLRQALLNGIQCLERNEQDPVNNQSIYKLNQEVAHTSTT